MKIEVLWRQLVGIGSEHLILSMDDAIHADSLLVGEISSTAYRIRYEIDCDASWNVRRVRIDDLLGGREVALVRDKNEHWSDNLEHPMPTLSGCTDVDIMITPFTNTLPIRRLDLKPGEAKRIAVVYVALPELSPLRLEQRYTCLSLDESGGIYRYESISNGFTAELKTDLDGLVVDYPNIFLMESKRRLASG